METLQTIGTALGYIQANGGLLIVGIIGVFLGVVFWMYTAMVVSGIRAEIKLVDQKVDAVDEKNRNRLAYHNKFMHLDDGKPVKLDLSTMMKGSTQ